MTKSTKQVTKIVILNGRCCGYAQVRSRRH